MRPDPIRAHFARPEPGKATIHLVDLPAGGGAKGEIQLFDVPWCDGLPLTVAELVYRLRECNDDEITVQIHSRGGSIVEGMALYTVLRMCKARVIVEIVGIAGSVASCVAMAGDVVRIGQGCFFAIHDAWMEIAGNAASLRTHADRLDKIFQPALIGAYLTRGEKLKADEAQLSEWMGAAGGDGTWFTADEALRVGFVDEVYDAPTPMNSVRLDGDHVPAEALARFAPQKPDPPADPQLALFAELFAHTDPPAEGLNVLAEIFSNPGDYSARAPIVTEADAASLESLFFQAAN